MDIYEKRIYSIKCYLKKNPVTSWLIYAAFFLQGPLERATVNIGFGLERYVQNGGKSFRTLNNRMNVEAGDIIK